MVSAESLIIHDQVRFISTDPWFVMRQIEQVIANFPHYAWFDPMTAYPQGKVIEWGPLFPVSAAALCLLFGATTRPEAAVIASLFPVVLGAAMVPVMYLTGRVLRDWRAGLISAGLIAVVAGEYMYRSFFGYVDHHIMEVLLSTVFVLIYLTLLRYPGWKEITYKDLHSIQLPLLLSLFAGVVYLLGLLNMPTMVLFALIAGIFTLVQGVADYFQGRSIAYLVFMNTSIFAVAIIGFLLSGVNQSARSLASYSIAHVYAYLMIIAASGVLYGLSIAFRKRKDLFVVSLLGTGLFAAIILFFALPEIGQMIVRAGAVFFTEAGQPYLIDELQPWDLLRAAAVFNTGLILMAAGFLVILYDIARTRRAVSMFVLVWGAVILFATIHHHRYEYYLAVPLVLLSALAVVFAWDLGGKDLLRLVRRTKDKDHRNEPRKDRKAAKQEKASGTRAALAVVALVLLALFAGISAFTSYSVASYPAFDRIPEDWFLSMEWMRHNTPDTGVDYSKIYVNGTFHYPDSAYGVLARWPAGHWITYIAERIPNANPFQDHITKSNSIYAFLSAEDEETALAVAKVLGTRYVVTDFGFAPSKSASGPTLNNTTHLDYYNPTMIQPLDSGGSRVLMLFSQPYFLAMSSRLHNFDGSMAVPDTAYYVEYTWQNGSYPVVSKSQQLPASEAREKAANAVLSGGMGAVALSGFLDQPVDLVPALRHFRLVYESPTNARQPGFPEMKSVKIFEIVNGARIRGEGTIELPLETNQGRQFTYRQQSSNGEFVVPYATVGSIEGGVRALGPYRINGTSMMYQVQEEDIMQGRLLN